MCIRVQPGVPAFTVKQPEDAMAVLRDRARETGVSVCSLSLPRCFYLVRFYLELLVAFEFTPV